MASFNKLIARYLKGEDTNVNLLYLGGVSTLGAILWSVLAASWKAPAAQSHYWLLTATGWRMIFLKSGKVSYLLLS